MKEKKGFTLIELLAVIVILAIIALIALPQILNILNKVRLNAAKDSTYGIIKAAETYTTNFMLDNNGSLPKEDLVFNCSSRECILANDLEDYQLDNLDKLSFKGAKPTSGKITISDNGRMIKAEDLIINGFKCNYTNDTATCISGSSETPEPTSPVVTGPTSENPPSINPSTGVNNYTGVLKIVYLDPTDLTKKCDASNSVSKTKTKTGCMKWYAYAEDDTTYTMILDHNTTAQVEWNSSGSNSSMKGVATQLASDTTGWNGNPRLITANEIVTITGNTSWPTGISYFDTLTASGTNEGKYGWLFDRTSSSCKTYGCLNNAIGTIGTFGYWTSSPIANTSDGVWAVYYFGYLGSNNVTAADRGVRPVITIDKSYVN